MSRKGKSESQEKMFPTTVMWLFLEMKNRSGEYIILNIIIIIKLKHILDVIK